MTDIYKLARPKLSGVPCQILSGHVSDNIKNRKVRDMLSDMPNFTGEIIVGRPQDLDCQERSNDFCESEDLMELFIFWVYDMRTTATYPLKDRLGIASSMVGACGPFIQYVDHELLQSEEDIEEYKAKLAEDGFTHMMLREPYGTFGTEDEETPTSTPM